MLKKYRAEIWILLIGVVIALSIIAHDLYQPKKPIPGVTIKKNFEGIRPLNSKAEILRGNPNADLFIVEYGDLQCPYCREEHPHLKKYIQSNRGLSGRVAWIFRPVPYIDNISDKKTETLLCIHLLYPNEITWKFIDQSLLVTQEKTYPFDRYERVFKNIGIDNNAINKCKKNSSARILLQQANYDIDFLKINKTPVLHFVTKEGNVLTQTEGVKTPLEIHTIVETIFEKIGV